MTSSGPDQPTAGPPGAEHPAPPPARGPLQGRVTPPDLGLAVAAVGYLVLAFLPWASVDFFTGSFSVDGFRFSGLVTVAVVFLLAAAVWSLLPAVTEVRLPFPRHAVSGGLAALAVLVTLIAWLRSLDYGFSAAAFLGLLLTLVAVALAVRGLLPDLRRGPARPAGAGPSAGPAGAPAGPVYGVPGWQPPGSAPRPGPPVGAAPPSSTPVYTPPPPTAPPFPSAPPPTPPAAAQPSAEEAGFWSRPGPGDPGVQSDPAAR